MPPRPAARIVIRTPAIAFALAAALALAACQPRAPEPEPEPEAPPPPPPSELLLTPAAWDDVAGWQGADVRAALSAALRSCAAIAARPDGQAMNPRAPYAGTAADWRAACARLRAADGGDDAAARAAFEAAFTPVRAFTEAGETGLMTGYYEPYVEVRRAPEPPFTAPLRGKPDDLLSADLGMFDEALAGRRIVGMAADGRFIPYRDRAAIEEEGAGEPFAFGRPIDVFFLQIQGSGRLVYPDGAQARAAFAAHNGLPYRSIGRILVERGEMELHQASKAGIEAWLNRAGPGAARALFNENPRYAFFAAEPIGDPALGPRGAAGLPLTPMASIAADPAFHAHGVPVWVEADLPEAPDWRGLVVIQDAGGAITGPLRGDFFWGWGEEADRRAGSTRAQARWTLLLPHDLAARLAPPPA